MTSFRLRPRQERASTRCGYFRITPKGREGSGTRTGVPFSVEIVFRLSPSTRSARSVGVFNVRSARSEKDTHGNDDGGEVFLGSASWKPRGLFQGWHSCGWQRVAVYTCGPNDLQKRSNPTCLRLILPSLRSAARSIFYGRVADNTLLLTTGSAVRKCAVRFWGPVHRPWRVPPLPLSARHDPLYGDGDRCWRRSWRGYLHRLER